MVTYIDIQDTKGLIQVALAQGYELTCQYPHLSLEKDAPDRRAIQSPEQGKIVELPRVGGLHHEYVRMAA